MIVREYLNLPPVSTNSCEYNFDLLSKAIIQKDVDMDHCYENQLKIGEGSYVRSISLILIMLIYPSLKTSSIIVILLNL